MSKTRYITIQIIPDDSSDAWTIKLRYRFFEFLFYAIIIALFAVALAAVKITQINGKVLTANHLAEINQRLVIKQEKMTLLEHEITLIAEQERKIRGIVGTFITENASDTADETEKNHLNTFSQSDLDKYIADIHAIEKKSKGPALFPSRDEIPNIWPVAGIISQPYNNGTNPEAHHEGVDIIAENNALVMSAARGIVIQSGQDRDLGRYIKIDHAYNVQTVYGHLSRSFVQVGDHVNKGTTLGTVGNSGNSFGPHLHYEISIKGKSVDPQNYLK
jgi:murein DD-endopeptidase MepM/ murein hydrolase activator NlpD